MSLPSLTGSSARFLIHHPISAHNMQFDWVKPTPSALRANSCPFLICTRQPRPVGHCLWVIIGPVWILSSFVFMVCSRLFSFVEINAWLIAGIKCEDVGTKPTVLWPPNPGWTAEDLSGWSGATGISVTKTTAMILLEVGKLILSNKKTPARLSQQPTCKNSLRGEKGVTLRQLLC